MKFIFNIYFLLCCCAADVQAGYSAPPVLEVVETAARDTSRQDCKFHRDTVYTHVRFRQGYSQLDPSFSDNNVRLKRLVFLLDSVASAPSVSIKSVTIKGAVSPEGSTTLNRRLALKRAENTRAYILEHTSLEDSLVQAVSTYIDWEMLSELIAATDQPWRDKALDIIANTPIWIFEGKKIVGGRKQQLQSLHGGRAWRYMSEHFFPAMRNARYSIIYEWEKLAPVSDEHVIPETIDTVAVNIFPVDTVVEKPVIPDSFVNDTPAVSPPVIATGEEETGGKFTVLLKTNMLYDAALTPNLGVEIPLGDRISVEADWMYARWNKHSAHKYWRIYGGDLTVYGRLGRLAPGKDRFTGHFLGVYGQMAVYDFQFGERKGVLSDKWNYAAGIAYKYSFPVSRRLYIECMLGVGYMWGIYKKHTPIDDCDVWLSTHRLHWFGPTRAGVSLVWKIGGADNDKGKKGGRR